ncbi:hypothetical protein [Streptomyces sp. 039-1]|uniref:hypothetical protein n=1 Tax=Streptomyces sp. 039-1 TaxID=2789263 RepID=UPI0039F4C92F
MEEVSIWHVTEETGHVDPEVLDGWSARPPQSLTGEQEIGLYQPPENWQGASHPAKTLSAAGFYAVTFVIGRESAQHRDILVKYRGVGYFKAADIERLSPGQWWVDGKVMNRTQFREHTADVC